MSEFFTFFIYFFIYSVLGWILETLYCRMLDGKWTNRGFLFGPYCPIYGFGSLLIIAFLSNFIDSPIKVFFLGMIFTSLLEYITSFLLEKIFNAKWWDYSNRKFNINGRICLLNSLEFAALGIILTYLVHPILSSFVLNIPIELLQLISLALITIMGIDTGSTIATLLNLKERLTALKESAEMLKAKKSLQSKLSEFDLAKELSEIRKNIASKRNYQIERILEAFPDLEFKGFKAQINEFKSEIQKIKEDIKKQKLAIKERQKELKIEKKNKKKNKIDNKENKAM
ncbi:MAG: hypothetical protein ACI4ON_02340 [Clostridia bacterium]